MNQFVMDQGSSTDELMNLDMSFLAGHRRSGGDDLRRLRDELSKDTDLDAAADGQRGGDSGATNGSTEVPASDLVASAEGQPATYIEDTKVLPEPPNSAGPDQEADVPVSLQYTDHQEAVQDAASAVSRGGSDEAGDHATLPVSGFRLGGVTSQPTIKALPDVITSALREQLRTAAMRELGVSDEAARAFSQRLGQGTLVTAFLLAQLDLRFEADPATSRATELFRSLDPLLGSAVARLGRLEHHEVEQLGLLRTLHKELAAVRQTSAVIEQAAAYLIADRTENFLRGSHDIHNAPIAHKSAVFVRDRARALTRQQQQLEQDREGRPIR